SLREAAVQDGAAAGLRPGAAGTHAALRDERAHGGPEGTRPGARRRSPGDVGRAVHLSGSRGASVPRGVGEHRRRGARSCRGRVHVHRSPRAPAAGRRRRAAHAVAVRAVRPDADARAALRCGPRRPPGGRAQGQHHRRGEWVPVRRVLTGGARPGGAPGGGMLRRPDRVAEAGAGGDGSAVRLAPLRRAVSRLVRPRARGAVGLHLSGNAVEFVLALHSHLPYVLNHGRWPHGSDWLCEAALDTYLPLLERLEELAAEGTPTPLTIGFTPVLANQVRRGIEQYLADAGFRYFFTDAHLAHAGSPLGAYGEIPLGAERFDAERHDPGSPAAGRMRAARSPYRAYRVSGRGVRPSVAALVRDPRSSMQIWSRHQGYPGDEWYLEFHKIRWPGGLKLWRVSGANVD